MVNFDNVTNENKTEHNLKLQYIPDHPSMLVKHIHMKKIHSKQNNNF